MDFIELVTKRNLNFFLILGILVVGILLAFLAIHAGYLLIRFMTMGMSNATKERQQIIDAINKKMVERYGKTIEPYFIRFTVYVSIVIVTPILMGYVISNYNESKFNYLNSQNVNSLEIVEFEILDEDLSLKEDNIKEKVYLNSIYKMKEEKFTALLENKAYLNSFKHVKVKYKEGKLNRTEYLYVPVIYSKSNKPSIEYQTIDSTSFNKIKALIFSDDSKLDKKVIESNYIDIKYNVKLYINTK